MNTHSEYCPSFKGTRLFYAVKWGFFCNNVDFCWVDQLLIKNHRLCLLSLKGSVMKYCSLVSLCTSIALIFSVQAMEKSTSLLESLTPPEQVVKELAEQQKKGPQALVYTLLNCQSLLYLQELVMQKTKENLKLLDEIKHYEEEISQSPYYKHTKETGKYSLLLEYPRNNQEMLAIYFKLITLLHSYGLSLANMPEEKLQEASRSLEAMEKMGSNDFAKAVLLDIQKTRADRKMTEAYDIIKAFLEQYEFSHIPKDACSQYYRSLEEMHKVTSAFRTILIDTEGEPSDEDYDRFNEQRKQIVAAYFKDGIREACYQLYQIAKQKINQLALVLKRRGTDNQSSIYCDTRAITIRTIFRTSGIKTRTKIYTKAKTKI